jgi:hypothetical protein
VAAALGTRADDLPHGRRSWRGAVRR